MGQTHRETPCPVFIASSPNKKERLLENDESERNRAGFQRCKLASPAKIRYCRQPPHLATLYCQHSGYWRGGGGGRRGRSPGSIISARRFLTCPRRRRRALNGSMEKPGLSGSPSGTEHALIGVCPQVHVPHSPRRRWITRTIIRCTLAPLAGVHWPGRRFTRVLGSPVRPGGYPTRMFSSWMHLSFV